MARNRSPNRETAFKIYKEHYGKITTREIALILSEKERNIQLWRSKDKWKENYNPKGGAPFGNKNAIGNNGGAPEQNQNSRKHGFYSKYLPKDTYDVFENIENMSTIDILWNNIKLKYAAIIRSQSIMFVKDQDDKTKELKKIKSQSETVGDESIEIYREEEYELQFAWDKQATFLNAQSRAMSQLTKMIKEYEELIHINWDIVTEEQKLRLERLKSQIDNPELKHRKQHDKKKLELEREKLEHSKKMDELKAW